MIVCSDSITYRRFISFCVFLSCSLRPAAKSRAYLIASGEPPPNRSASRLTMTLASASSSTGSTFWPKAGTRTLADVVVAHRFVFVPLGLGEFLLELGPHRRQAGRIARLAENAKIAAIAREMLLGPLGELVPRCFRSSLRRTASDRGCELHLSATPKLRSGSYSSSTLAWASTSAAPRLSGWLGLPSILIGRPSKLVTSRPWATPPISMAVA